MREEQARTIRELVADELVETALREVDGPDERGLELDELISAK